jgi:predicted XRE-type DNA-binding protein
MKERIRRSRGNIFEDLGSSPTEAANLKARSHLMMELAERIRRKGWTQQEAAKALGVTQPRVSDLVRGKIDRFSVDNLIELLGRAGVEITFSAIRRKRRVA